MEKIKSLFTSHSPAKYHIINAILSAVLSIVHFYTKYSIILGILWGISAIINGITAYKIMEIENND